jgi:hypothetical protein
MSEAKDSEGGVREAMKKVLVFGAGGQIAQWVIEMLKNNSVIRVAPSLLAALDARLTSI